MLACSRPRNFRVLELRHIAAYSDESASATVDEVGTSLAVANARERPRRTLLGWLSPAPKRRETLNPYCAETPASLACRPACDQVCGRRPHVPAPEQRITDGFGRVSWRRGCGVIRRRHRRGSGRSNCGRGRLNLHIIRRCGTGRRLRQFRLNCLGRGNQRFPRLVPCDVA